MIYYLGKQRNWNYYLLNSTGRYFPEDGLYICRTPTYWEDGNLPTQLALIFNSHQIFKADGMCVKSRSTALEGKETDKLRKQFRWAFAVANKYVALI